MTLEGGKPLVENGDEIGWTAAAFDYYAEIGRDSRRPRDPARSRRSQLALVVKDPVGVVGCIVPWNYPLLLLAWKLAPALAAGNATVCKPSEVTPLSTLALADCFDHLPAGVVNLVAGAGDVGAAIVADERVDCVAFTGSVETGKRIAAACAERVARVNLEMGGKDPFIVCADVAAEDRDRRPRRRLGRVPERGPGLHLGRALLRRSTTSTTTTCRRSSTTPRALVRRRPDATPRTDVGPMVSAAQRREGRRPGRGGGRRRRRAGRRRRRRRATSAGTSSPRRWSPAPPPRPRC